MTKKGNNESNCSEWTLTAESLPNVQKLAVRAQHKHMSLKTDTCAVFKIQAAEQPETCYKSTFPKLKKSHRIKFQNGTASYTFENITKGLYCIYFTECKSNDDCMIHSNQAADFTAQPATLPFPYDEGTQININEKIIFGILGAICSLMIFSLLVILHIRKRRRRYEQFPLTETAGIETGRRYEQFPLTETAEIETEPRVQKVFLLYSHDFDLHNEAVNTFAQVLEKCFKCDVAFDERELKEILSNEHAWVHQVQYRQKIIIISSEGAYLQEQAWLNNEVALVNSSHDLDYNFLPSLCQLTLCQQFNYADVMNIRFSYTDVNFLVRKVVPFRHYEVPKDLEVIAKAIHDDIQLRYSGKDEVFRKLFRIIGQCKTFLDNNPDHIRSALQPYDSMRPITNTDLQENAHRNSLHFQASVNS